MGVAAAGVDAAPLSRLRLCSAGAGSGGVSLDVNAGIAIERRMLDAALVNAAEHAGVVFRPRCSAKVVARVGSSWRVRVADREVAASVVVACDGLTGTSLNDISDSEGLGVVIDPAAWMGAGTVIEPARAHPWHAHVAPGEVAMHIGPAGYVGLVRLADGAVDLAAALDAAHVKAAGGPAPAIAEVLEACAVANARELLAHESIAGTGLLTRRRSRTAARSGGLIVAGDAAGYVEPFTGEGIAWALVQGERAGFLAARAARDARAWSSLAGDWTDWLAGVIEPRRRACRAVRWTLRHPGARRGAFVAMSRSALARAAATLFVRAAWRSYPSPRLITMEATPCAS